MGCNGENNTACECIGSIAVLRTLEVPNDVWQTFMDQCMPGLSEKLCHHLEPVEKWYEGLVQEVERIQAAKPNESNRGNAIQILETLFKYWKRYSNIATIKSTIRNQREREREREREIDDQINQRPALKLPEKPTSRASFGCRSLAASSAPEPASFWPSSIWQGRARIFVKR